jgi:hypothetical protein
MVSVDWRLQKLVHFEGKQSTNGPRVTEENDLTQ